MSTPPATAAPAGSIVVRTLDGLEATWAPPGTWSGETSILDAAARAVDEERVVSVLGVLDVEAGSQGLGALAALMAHDPGRTVVVAAPPDVIAALDDAFDEHDEHVSDLGGHSAGDQHSSST